MARIRSIKPEFPQSESMGNVSRDARLTFIQLWTLADDSGRLRGNSRMLASLLFPYDDDAPGLIDTWLFELEREGCLVRYSVESTNYVQLCNWLKHQKIDKPTPSKIPEFEERYRILANPRESYPLDQGSKDQGIDQGSKDRSDAIASLVVSHSADAQQPDLLAAVQTDQADDALDAAALPAGIPDCPHQEIVALYAELLPMLPQVRIWEGQRANNLRARWRWVMTHKRASGERVAETKAQGLDFFRRYFVFVSESDFLTGRNGSWDGCSLEWLTKQNNFAKVLEGNYRNKTTERAA